MNQMHKRTPFYYNPIFFLICLGTVIGSYCFFDQSIATWFYDQDSRQRLFWLYGFTALGQWKLYILLFAGLIAYFRWYKKDSDQEGRIWYLLACVLSVNLVGLILKVILGRARPELFLFDQLFGFYWFKFSGAYWSFPSGHTITSVSLAFGLSVLFPRYRYAFFAVALMVCFSRIALYYHYLSDVLASAYLSVAGVGLVTRILRDYEQKGVITDGNRERS